MVIKVFIQNEQGSNRKNYHDEKTFDYKFTKVVSRPYPYPYGFIIGTSSADGCNLDCLVITDRRLKTGQILECEPVGLMEQIEDGLEDHNILARVVGDDVQITPEVEATLTDFVVNVFSHIEGKQIGVGRFLGPEQAEEQIRAHADPIARNADSSLSPSASRRGIPGSE